MSEPSVHAAVPGMRSQLKAAQRTLRTTLQMLADFEERLDALDAQPEEAQRNDDSHDTDRRDAGTPAADSSTALAATAA